MRVLHALARPWCTCSSAMSFMLSVFSALFLQFGVGRCAAYACSRSSTCVRVAPFLLVVLALLAVRVDHRARTLLVLRFWCIVYILQHQLVRVFLQFGLFGLFSSRRGWLLLYRSGELVQTWTSVLPSWWYWLCAPRALTRVCCLAWRLVNKAAVREVPPGPSATLSS